MLNLNLFQKPDSEEQEKEHASPLSKEEIRRRRLEKVSQSSNPVGQDIGENLTGQSPTQQPFDSATKRDSSEMIGSHASTDTKGSHVQEGMHSKDTPDNSETHEMDIVTSPVKKSLKSEAQAHASAVSPSGAALAASPSKNLDPVAAEAARKERDAKLLNLCLEHALMVTFNKSHASETVLFMSQEDTSSSSSTSSSSTSTSPLLNAGNLQEIVCWRLSSDSAFGPLNAVNYLTGCYKRLLGKEAAASPKVREELTNCRGQVISFLVSCLSVPEMFDSNSANSVSDLMLVISEDASSSITTLLRDLVNELDREGSLEDVITQLVDLCNQRFDTCPPLAQPINPFSLMGENGKLVRSVLDNYVPPIAALNQLIHIDKRVCRIIAAMPHGFQYDDTTMGANAAGFNLAQFQNLHPAITAHPRFVESVGRRGAALENRTLLGRVLRIAPHERDPKLMEFFKELRVPRNVHEGRISDIRKRCLQSRSTAADWLLSLLKACGPAKAAAMQWMVSALTENIEAEKDRPSPLLGASVGFMVNFGAVMLELARPVMVDSNKLSKADAMFLLHAEGKRIFPEDVTRLMPLSHFLELSPDLTAPPPLPPAAATTDATSTSTKDFNFITQSFFMCWRALHLGIVSQCIKYENTLRAVNHHFEALQNATGDMQAIYWWTVKNITDAQLLGDDLLKDIVLFCAAASAKLLAALDSVSDNEDEQHTAAATTATTAAHWLITPDKLTADQRALLLNIPEHLLDDIMTLLLFVARTVPATLNTCSLEATLSLMMFFFRRPWAIQSPHLRAKCGLVLYQVFLPVSARDREQMYSNNPPVDGPHTALLSTHVAAQKFLAPALLLLYGDVERTGYYEKLTNRRCIMLALKHLWTLESHRPAFRGIATIDSDATVGAGASGAAGAAESDTGGSNSSSSSSSSSSNDGENSFVKFANGLMNETNALVATTMDKLAEIKKTQQLMQNAVEWGQLSEEEKTQIKEKHESNEQECRGSAQLCLETVDMLNYLTSDDVIRQPFLHSAILPRFTSTLLNVLLRITGPKSLELKVDNMESYHFEPKVLLRQVCQAMVHFYESQTFWEAVAQDSFYDNGRSIKKAIGTVSKLHLLDPSEIMKLEQLYAQAEIARVSIVDMDAIIEQAPEEFLDSLLYTLMRDPVKLPSSHNVVDRATIQQQLLNDPHDPFNRQPLQISMVEPLPELKQRIEAWLQEKTRELQQQQQQQQQSTDVDCSSNDSFTSDQSMQK